MANMLDTITEWIGPDHNKKQNKTAKMKDHPERKSAEYMLGSGMAKGAAKVLRKRKDIGDLSQY